MLTEIQDDLLVISKFKNAILYKAIMDLYPSIAEFCRVYGMYPTQVGDLLNLKENPRSRIRNGWKPFALKIAEILGFSPDELFPETLYNLQLPNEVQRTYKSPEIFSLQEAAKLSLPSPDIDTPIINNEMSDKIKEVLLSLPPREEKVLRLRFGLDGEKPHTLAEVGEEFAVSRERIREIENKALRLLRHPMRSKQLYPFIEGAVNYETDRQKVRRMERTKKAVELLCAAIVTTKHQGNKEKVWSDFGNFKDLMSDIVKKFDGKSIDISPRKFANNLNVGYKYQVLHLLEPWEELCKIKRCWGKCVVKELLGW